MDMQPKNYIKSSNIQICIFRVVRVLCQTLVKRKEKCIYGKNTFFHALVFWHHSSEL